MKLRSIRPGKPCNCRICRGVELPIDSKFTPPIASPEMLKRAIKLGYKIRKV